MSTWKNYGGLHNAEKNGRISAEYITVKEFILEEPYNGLLNIIGELRVSGNTNLDVLNVANDTFINNNAVIGRNGADRLIINSDTTFTGDAIFQGGSATTGNIISLESLVAYRNVFLGNTICFGNRYFPPVQAIYSGINGLGINQNAPEAALDISSNQPYSINVVSSNPVNKSVLVQNVSGQCIMLAVDPSNSSIQFYHDNKLVSGKADAFINYYPGGFINIDASQNLNVSSQMTIADNNKTNVHVNNETLAVYDISNGNYYPTIYNKNMLTGSAATFITSDLSSNTFIHINTPDKKGVSIGGGAYPVDNSYRHSGIVSLSNNTNPTQMMVAGNSTVKYFSTTGINTFQPRIDEYVLDVNGPVHIDNGDSVSVVQTPFQLYQLSMARNYPNMGIAIGSSIDFSANVATYFREKIIKTMDYGQTWSTIDLSYSFLNNCDFFTSVFLVDTSYCFITGNTTLLFSPNAGRDWNIVTNLPNIGGTVFNNISIHPNRTVKGNLYGYMSVDKSPSIISFEYDPNVNSGILFNPQIITNTFTGIVQHIETTATATYLAGSAILKYDSIPGQLPVFNGVYHTYLSYKYNMVKALNNFIIGVGNNIISSSIDAGLTWTDVPFNINGSRGVDFKAVHIIDNSNAIAAGSYGNIWVTNNSGTSWNFIPKNLINASGKFGDLTSNSNTFEDIIMPDINTILLVNTKVPYIVGSQTGNSNIYNVFAPNYLNRANNVVLDISGTVNVSGDLKVNDNGSVITTNSLMNLFNTTVNTIRFGGDATNIIVGSSISGNTQIRTNLIANNNVTLDSNRSVFSSAGRMDISGNVNIGGNLTIARNVDISGNLSVNLNTNLFKNVFVNSSDIILDRGNVVVGNVFPIGTALTIGGANNDIYIGGLFNTNRSQKIYIGQNELQTRGSAANPSTIYVGGVDDNVILRGNTNILNMQKLVVRGPTAVVNVPTEGFGANVTCAGAGIDIFDNSYTSIVPNDIYGYMRVGKDMQSFIFKAPSYGSFTNPINKTGALYNTFNNIQLLSDENRLGLGVNELSLTGKKIRTGLVVLQNRADFRSYQARYDHSYLSGADDVDHVMNLLADFDVSNILLKDFIIGPQNIISEVVVGNTTSPNSIFTFGNVITYGNTFIYGNTTTYKDIVTSGNILITSTTRARNATTGALVVSGGVGVGGNIVINGTITTYSSDFCSIASTAPALSNGTAGLILTGGLFTGKNAYISGNIFIAAGSETSTIESNKNGVNGDGALKLTNGGLYAKQNIYIGGNIISENSADTINGVKIANRAMSNITTINASGVATFTNNQNAAFSGTGSGSVVISSGGLYVHQDIYVKGSSNNNTGTSTFASVASSSDPNTGALVVTGGVGIGGNLRVGSTASSSDQNTGAFVVTGGVGIGGNLRVGSTTVSTNTTTGAFVVAGAVGIGGNINASVNQTINGVSINNRAMSNITTITASGQVTLTAGTTSTDTLTGTLVVTGGVGISGAVFIGGIANASTFNATSDYRLKNNVQPLSSSRTIDLLKPVEYSMTGGMYQMGFLAHEVQEIFPFLVTGEKDGTRIQTLNYNGFIPLLVKEIQDLKSENKLLKSRLDAIEKIIEDNSGKSRIERFHDTFPRTR